MSSLPLSRVGAGKVRAAAWIVAVVLPLAVLSALGAWVITGPGVLLQMVPVVVAAALGGLGPALLATAAGAAPAVLHVGSGGAVDGLAWVAAFAALALAVIVLVERERRRGAALSAEFERVGAANRFQQAVAELATDCAWQGRLEDGRLLIEHATPEFVSVLGLTVNEVNTRGG